MTSLNPANTVTEHRLAGCQPEPLLSYLKALGVFRIVAEQADPSATGHWAADGFVLRCHLDDDGLGHFFLHDYRPTPVLSPWNSSSGFGKEGVDELGAIERSDLARLAPFREAAAVARRLLERFGGEQASKEDLIAACRAELPDPALPWVDASAVLVDDRVVYPPLLGTGGNDGRLDFSRNSHRRVLEVVGLGKASEGSRRAWLDGALDGTPLPLLAASPGQFDGGAAGAPNSAPSGAAEGLVNPWDWVLLIEGSLLFAAGAARRLASSTAGRAAAPFTVDASAAGYATAASDEKGRGELWLPLWDRPAAFSEIRRLFAEARADWQGRRASSALDLVRATGDLGVDRGISAFSRHVLAERNGLATVATPVGRIVVTRRPAVLPLGDLDEWMARVRSIDKPPAAVASALRRLERLMYAAAAAAKPDLVAVLVAAADLNGALSRSRRARERVWDLRLKGGRWLDAIDPGPESEPELRLAVSLASGGDEPGPASGGLRRLVMASWKGDTVSPPLVEGLGVRPVVEVVAAAHARRVIQNAGAPSRAQHDDEQPGVESRFQRGVPAPPADIVALAAGAIDQARLGEVLRALLLLEVPPGVRLRGPKLTSPVPVPLALLGPFYSSPPPGEPSAEATWLDRARGVRLRPEAPWVAQLMAGQVEAPLAAAVRRLRIAALSPLVDTRLAVRGLGPRAGAHLAATLLVPMPHWWRADLLARTCPRPEDERDGDGAQDPDKQGGGGNAQP